MKDAPGINWAAARAHGPGFFASGLIATAVDVGVLVVLTHAFGVDPYSARVAAIGVAMVAAYFAHRRLTFKVETAPTFAEFFGFVGVAAGTAVIGYAIFAAALYAFPALPPVGALLIATPVAMACSYFGYRFGVFGR